MSEPFELRTLEKSLRSVFKTMDVRLGQLSFANLDTDPFRGSREIANTTIHFDEGTAKLHIANNERGNFRVSLLEGRTAAHVVCIPIFAINQPSEWFPDMRAARRSATLEAELGRYNGESERDRVKMALHVFARAIYPHISELAVGRMVERTADALPSHRVDTYAEASRPLNGQQRAESPLRQLRPGQQEG